MRFGKSTWNKSKISDEIETVTDFVAAGSFADLRNKVKYLNEPNYAQLIRTTDLKNGFDEGIYIDNEAFDFLWRVNLDKEAIILPNIGANIGESYFINPRKLPYKRNVLGPNAILLRSKKNNNYFIYSYFQTNSAKNNIAKMVGASGQPKFNKTDLRKFELYIPSIEEQNKIADFLNLIDVRIDTQNKIIRDLKVLIKRFLDFDYKTNTSEYEDVLLSSILTESKILNSNNNEVYSVAVEDGVVNQVEHLGRSFAAKDTSNYHVAKYGDIIYTKSPTGSFPYGIVKQSFIKNDVAVSPLYGIYHPNSYEIGYYIHHYFLYAINCNNYLHPLVNKGAKNTMNITNTRFLEGKILVPNNNERVINIHHFLHVINKKLQNEIAINNKLLDQKAFLLKNLFI